MRQLGSPRLAIGIFLLGLFARQAASTTVIAPTFDELVAGAESIVVASVVDIHAAWVESRFGRAIVTDVTITIDRTLKGHVYSQRSLEFLGGTVGDVTLSVSGMPAFHVGDRDVLFIKDSGRPASPLVGFGYGRFRVVRDTRTGIEMIRTGDGRPLAGTEDVGNAKTPAFLPPARTLTLDEF